MIYNEAVTNQLTFPSVDITGCFNLSAVSYAQTMSGSASGPLQNIYYKRVRYL